MIDHLDEVNVRQRQLTDAVHVVPRQLLRRGRGQMAALTPQESRVATLAAGGLRNREIADRLGLSPKTVEWRLTRVYRKLGLRSRTELALRVAAARAAGENPWAEKPEQ